MQQTPVESSTIRSVGYDPHVHILEIIFLNGDIYHYAFVPPEVYADMSERIRTKTESVGKFFHARIKPVYAFRKATPWKQPQSTEEGTKKC